MSQAYYIKNFEILGVESELIPSNVPITDHKQNIQHQIVLKFISYFKIKEQNHIMKVVTQRICDEHLTFTKAYKGRFN